MWFNKIVLLFSEEIDKYETKDAVSAVAVSQIKSSCEFSQ